MKFQNLPFLIVFWLSFNNAKATICPSIVLTTQIEVDAFASFNCDTISGSLIINGLGITNLDSLIGLRHIQGPITIDSTSIENLSGLDSLRTVGYLNIRYCFLLENLTVLSQLDSLGFIYIHQCHSLQAIVLNSFSYLGYVYIEGNNLLNIVDMGNNLNTNLNLSGGMTIRNNPTLDTIRILINATYIGDFSIYDNPLLSFIYPYENLAISSQTYISNNDNLSELICFPALRLNSSHFTVTNNEILNRILLPKIRQIKDLHLTLNPNLNDCCFLSSGIIFTGSGLDLGNNGEDCSEFGHLISHCETIDPDGDNVLDPDDNCPLSKNPNQADLDLDGVGNDCDNCPSIYNPSQLDSNLNGIGDLCDSNYQSKIGLHTDAPLSGVHIDSSDLYIGEIQRGIILRNILGDCFRVSIDEQGQVKSSAIPCPN